MRAGASSITPQSAAVVVRFHGGSAATGAGRRGVAIQMPAVIAAHVATMAGSDGTCSAIGIQIAIAVSA